jgi:hypothetical protein
MEFATGIRARLPAAGVDRHAHPAGLFNAVEQTEGVQRATTEEGSEAADEIGEFRIGESLTPGAATESEVAVVAFAPLLALLVDVPDPRRGQGKLYKLPHVLLFSILAIVTGGNSFEILARQVFLRFKALVTEPTIYPYAERHDNIAAMNLHLAEMATAVAPGADAMLLPPKCPELNPTENVWQFMRDNWLSNRVFPSYDAIVDHCCDAWKRLVD